MGSRRINCGLLTIAAGFGALAVDATEHLHTKDRWFLFGGLTLYFLTSLFAGIAGRAPLRWYLGWLVPSLLASVALAVFGHPLPAWALAVLVLVVLGWFSTYNSLVGRVLRG